MISDITGSEKVLSDACATRWGKRQRAARSNNEKSLTTPSYVWRHRQDVVETQPAAHKCTTVSRDPHEEGFDPGPCGAMVRTVFGNAPLLLKILPDRSSLLTPAPASNNLFGPVGKPKGFHYHVALVLVLVSACVDEVVEGMVCGVINIYIYINCPGGSCFRTRWLVDGGARALTRNLDLA